MQLWLCMCLQNMVNDIINHIALAIIINSIMSLNPNPDTATTRKRQAFKSFLETSASPSTVSTMENKKNASDNEAMRRSMWSRILVVRCVGPRSPMRPLRRRIDDSGFCQQVACAEHLRKRRRRKNKWEKICDNCQDKFLYDSYMKLQIKAQQSLAVEQEIVSMKYEDMKQLLQGKKIKRRQLSFNSEQTQSKYDQKIMALTKQDNRFQSINNKLESDELTCGQVEQYIHRMQNKIKSNFQQDFRILTEEDERLGAQLSRVDKKCSEVRSAIEKREKDLEEAYERWERKQYGQLENGLANGGGNGGSGSAGKKEEGGCYIF